MGCKLICKWILLILAIAVCKGHPIIQEVEEDAIIATSSVSSVNETDGATEPSQSPPPDLEALQAEARYDASAMLQQPSATSTRHADSCEAEGRSYKHGDKIWRPDPCETCMCLDGETFCWWQQCEINHLPDEPLMALVKDDILNKEKSSETNKDSSSAQEETIITEEFITFKPNEHNDDVKQNSLSINVEKSQVTESTPKYGLLENVIPTQNTLTSNLVVSQNADNTISNFSVFTESDVDKQSSETTNSDILLSINTDNGGNTSSQKSTDFEEQNSTFQQSAETNDASVNLSTESFISTINDIGNYTTNDAFHSSSPDDVVSSDTITMETRKQVTVTRMCTVMGVDYAVGAVLPGETGNCLRCVCSEVTPSVGGVTASASADDRMASPVVTCHPHDCAPLTRKDILEDTMNSF